MRTIVVNLRAGALLDRDTVYVGRAGKGLDGTFGNPHHVGVCPYQTRTGVPCGQIHERGEAVAAFTAYFHERVERDTRFRQSVHRLRGKKLACFCAPRACHADVYAAYLNALPGESDALPAEG